jgi:transcription initiation factor TFIIB
MAVVGKKTKKCPNCGSKKITVDKSRGEKICQKCGLVIAHSMVDRGREWRAFDHEQMSKKARTGPPRKVTKHDKGLSTSIGRGSREIARKVHPKKRYQYYRMKKWHRRLIESKDRNLSFALSELQRYVSFLDLPQSVHERVARHYEQALDKGFIRGRAIEAVLSGLIYAISKNLGVPRTLEEIQEVSGMDKLKIGRTYRFITRKLGIRILPAKPVNYIPRFRTKLGLSIKTESKAIRILKKADKENAISGKAPTGVAAAALYIASILTGEERTQREIANILPITEVTIRNNQKEIVEKLKIDLKEAKK